MRLPIRRPARSPAICHRKPTGAQQFYLFLPDGLSSRLTVHERVPRGGPRRGDLDMRRIVVGGWWMVRLLAGLTIMAALALAVPLGAAAATQPDTATADSPATAQAEPTEAAPEPSP